MDFNIPMKRTPVLDSRSLADKRGFMNIRQSLDRNSLDNKSFVKTPQRTVPVTEPAPVKPVRKQRNLPAGNVYLKKGQKVPVDNTSVMKIALGWDILDSRCELDGSAFM
ncbi:MAG: TerD family protein, partial [Ruminococcus sp.]|nr:TerD family protein [Ruminococcus sp.]